MPNSNTEFFALTIVSLAIASILVVFIVMIFKLYQKKKLVQEKELASQKAAFETELIQTRLEIQEDVLRNISMEIHDNIGQVMLMANVNFSILQTMTLPAEAPELIIETKKLISKATEDLSQLSRSLHSDRITEIGVFAAIKYELRLFSQKNIFDIDIEDTYDSDGKHLPKEIQLLVFRMFQEICNNIIKHAKATKVSLHIAKIPDGIDLKIADNGLGFDFHSKETTGSGLNGVGLRSLQSRVALFNGKIQFDSILKEGTTISIFIPVNEN